MTKGMRVTGKRLKAAHEYARKEYKRAGRRAVRHALKRVEA